MSKFSSSKDTKNLELVKHLEESMMLKDLAKPQLALLFEHCEWVEFPSDTTIVKQGKPAQGIYVIVSGKVHLVARTLGEGSTKIMSLSKGDVLGGTGFIEKGPFSTSAITQTRVQCIYLGRTCLELLAAIDPQTKYKIFLRINKQVCRSMKKTHDKVVRYISQSDMFGLSFIGRALYSMSQPKEFEVNKEDVLKKIWRTHLLDGFSNEEKTVFFSHSAILESPKNCVLVHEREKKPSCFIVIHGAVQSSIMKDNKVAKLSVIGPNSLFAGVACVDKKSEFTITFMACERTILLKIGSEDMAYFQKKKPKIWFKLYNLISESLVALGKSIHKLDVRLHIETYNR